MYQLPILNSCNRLRFPPRNVGEHVWGETVAVHLEQLLLRHGPPLVLKRDNGSNLNQQAVDEVLARYLVMPLNSPPHYPPYNGGMECAVRELKTPLREKILASGPSSESQVLCALAVTLPRSHCGISVCQFSRALALLT